MAINVRVSSQTGTTVAVKSQENYRIRTIGVAPAGTIEHNITGANNLIELQDVDASSVDNNETVVYDENSAKFVIKELPVLKGGTF
jgi:hypothetical protein